MTIQHSKYIFKELIISRVVQIKMSKWMIEKWGYLEPKKSLTALSETDYSFYCFLPSLPGPFLSYLHVAIRGGGQLASFIHWVAAATDVNVPECTLFSSAWISNQKLLSVTFCILLISREEIKAFGSTNYYWLWFRKVRSFFYHSPKFKNKF